MKNSSFIASRQLFPQTRNSWLRPLAFAAVLGLCASACSDDDPTGPDPEPTDPYSTILTYAGTGISEVGLDNQPPLSTGLYQPQDLTFGPDGKAYIVDHNNHRIRVVSNGTVQTLIGTGEIGDASDNNGAGIDASLIKLNHPTHISFDPNGQLILSAWHNSKVMRMDPSSGTIKRICGGVNGQRAYGGENGPAIDALLDLPSCTAFDSRGRMFITDQANQLIRMVDENDIISIVAGKPKEPGFSGDGGPANLAQIFLPGSQSAPPVGRIAIYEDILYICDTANSRIRIVDLNTGIINTFAGSDIGYDGDGGPATAAKLKFPADVAVSPDGDVFIADTRNNVIRKVDKDGIISTFAGTGVAGFGGDGGSPEDAQLFLPYGIEFDARGNLFIADTHNHRIRVIPREGTSI